MGKEEEGNRKRVKREGRERGWERMGNERGKRD